VKDSELEKMKEGEEGDYREKFNADVEDVEGIIPKQTSLYSFYTISTRLHSVLLS
jgi:hypothetical protein